MGGAAEATTARQVARAALAVELGRLAPEVVAKAKHCLLDFIACACETGDLPWSRQALAVTRRIADAYERFVNHDFIGQYMKQYVAGAETRAF